MAEEPEMYSEQWWAGPWYNAHVYHYWLKQCGLRDREMEIDSYRAYCESMGARIDIAVLAELPCGLTRH